MAIKSGLGGGTGTLDDLEQQLPLSTFRSTVWYFPSSKTFFVVSVAEAEAMTLFEASKLVYQFLCLIAYDHG